MRTRGKVAADGRVEVNDRLPTGTTVEVITVEDDDLFDVDEELKADLLQAIENSRRGHTVSAEEVLRRLKEI